MSTYQTLAKQALEAQTQARARLEELRLAVANLRNDLAGRIQAPEGSVNIVQGKPDGTLKTVIPQSLTYTEGHTIQFQIQVRLDGAKSAVAKLSVPAAVAHADASIVLTIEDNRSHGYRPDNNAGVISLIVDSLARQAGEVGV